MGLARFPISDFRGGLNTRDGPFALETNEAQRLLNVTLSSRGVLKQREGKTRFDSSGQPGVDVEHMRPWYPSGSVMRLMESVNGDIYAVTQGGVASLVFDGTAGKTWHFEQGTDGSNVQKLWCMNGTDNPKKIDTTIAATDWANSPPNGTMLRLWKNRMCIAGVAAFPQRLFFSDIGNPESPASSYGTNWVDIKATEDDLDAITWIEVFEDFLVVFKKNSVWVVYDSNTFANRRIGGPGCEDRFQSAVVGGKCYYFNKSGVWSIYDGSHPPRIESEKIENFITENLNYSAISSVRLAPYGDRRLLVAFPFGSSNSNNRVLELIPDLVAVEDATDPRDGAWMVHDLPCSAICTFRPVFTNVIVGADPASHRLHTLFEGSNDDGSAISSYWMSSWRPIQSEEPIERIRRINVELTGEVTVVTYRDFDPAQVFSKRLATPTPTDPLWDGGTWDGGVWDPVNSTQLLRARPEKRGRYHAIEFNNAVLNKTFTIYAAEIVYRGGKEHTK